MKIIGLIFTVGFIAINSLAQSGCTIKKEYKKIFKIEKKKFGEREYLMKTVNEIDVNACFAELVNNHRGYIDYLRTNFSDNSNYQKLIAISDTIELQNEFIQSLENDSLLNSVMNKLARKMIEKSNFIPDTISLR